MKNKLTMILMVSLMAAIVIAQPQPASGSALFATLATITVNSTADAIAADGVCTFREAITAANTNAVMNECTGGTAGLDTITFAIGAAGSQQTIQPLSALPTISDPVTIDGWSQGGAGYSGPPLVEINGSAISAWNTTNGLQVTAGSSTFQGLAINYFNIAINLETAGDNVIAGNYIGVALDGVTAVGNRTGMRIANASDHNRIGTNGDGVDDAAERNIISASGFVQQNNSTGILIDLGSDDNWIAGNFIGTDASGSLDLGNASNGITTGGVTIIGTNGDGVGDAVEGNLISGNNGHGVALTTTSSGSRVAGNKIGTNTAGTAAIPNNSNGISVGSCSPGQCSNYMIGTNGDGLSDALEGNLVSGNGANGVFIPAGTLSGNVVAGNKIGTDISGTAAIPNGDYGVQLGGTNSRIGANIDGISDALEGNLISGNGAHGVYLPGTTSNNNLIAGNQIGTNSAGTAALPNLQSGILIESSNSVIRDNLISGNAQHGVHIYNSYFNTVAGNRIGTAGDGVTPLGNTLNGVYIATNSDDHTIGGTGAGEGNRIAYNGGDGVFVDGGSSCGAAFCLRNHISGNSIFDNGGLGIDLYPNGVNANDLLDPDTGTNTRQNYPLLNAAANTGASLIITGTLNSTANLTFTLDFYSSPTCDPSGSGEGELYLGAGLVATDANGEASFAVTVAGLAQDADAINATASDPEGNTSEFSGCIELVGEEPILGLQAANDSPTYPGLPTHFSATLTSGTGVSYAWDFGDGSSGNGTAPSHIYSTAGAYTATLTASNSLGSQVATTSVTILPLPVCAATPDDGLTVFGSPNASAVQQAVDAAAGGATVKIAGTSAGVSSRQGTTQTVYISNTVNLAGGYTLDNWIAPDPANAPTTLDALHLGRVVFIAGDSSNSTRLENLTLVNGNGSGSGTGFCPGYGCGGGFFTEGSLDLRQVNFENNQANRGGGAYVGGFIDAQDSNWLNNLATSQRGGGLEVYGNATITGGLWQNNAGLYGGGMFAGFGYYTLTISGTQFISNTATSPAGGSGGALYTAGALNITNAYFEGNRSQTGGGAILQGPIGDQFLSIVHTQFIDNAALNTSAQGGALYTTAAGSTISSSTFAGNSAPGASGAGGAIVAFKHLTLTETILISNTTGGQGGAIYHWGLNETGNTSQVYPLVLQDVRLAGNQAGGEGGGLYFRRGFAAVNTPIQITHTTFEGNTAGLAGGGAYLGQPASISGNLFEANLSLTAAGGGLYSADRLSLSDTSFQGNSARHAGGAYIAGNLQMSASNWLGNTATTEHAGALEVHGAAQITGGLVQGNAGSFAGGIYADTSLVITGTQFISNTATSQYAGVGGAIYAAGPLAITEALFAGNLAQVHAGAVMQTSGSNQLLTITATDFLNNTALSNLAQGGALLTNGPSGTIHSSVFQGNSVPGSAGVGGAIVAYQAITLTATTLISNTAGGDGGAIYHWGSNGANDTVHPLWLVDSWLAHNQSGNSGGGVYFRSLTSIGTPSNIPIHVINTDFENNQAELQGGGIYLGQRAQIEHSTFRENTSLLSSGGGIFAYNNLILDASLLIDNFAYANGAALAVQGPNNLPGQVINSIFSGNSTQLAGAAVQMNMPATLEILHTTLAGDGSAPQGVAASSGNIQITNSMLVSHTLGILASAGATITADHTLFHGNQADTQGTVTNSNAVFGDPYFLDASRNDYHLALGSAAIDAAQPGSTERDYDGDLRPIVTQADIGADEFGSSAVADPGGTTELGGTVSPGRTYTVTIPGGALGGRVTIGLLPVPRSGNPPPAPRRAAGPGFILLPVPGGVQHGPQVIDPYFLLPVEITLTYTDDDLAGLDENSLFLAVWDADAAAWVDATAVCLGSDLLTREPAINRITVKTCATGEFALLADPPAVRLYLPVVQRQAGG